MTIEKQTNMQVEEEDTEEMDLGDLNLDKLEKSVRSNQRDHTSTTGCSTQGSNHKYQEKR